MAKRVHYIYNPSTDNFERYYPTVKNRLVSLGRYMLWGVVLATGFVWVFYIAFGLNDKSYIINENRKLKENVKLLNRKVNDALVILGDIRSRDDNFYRVMLQMDPMSVSRRYAGLQRKERYMQYSGLSNSDMMIQLNRNIDLLERQLYTQSLSFDELRRQALNQRDKIDHVPGVFPINIEDYTVSSGYGYRVDPVYGGTRFHEGLDFAAPNETPIYATAAGTVVVASPNGGYGNCVEIDHGYNYVTRFGHLNSIDVKVGQTVRRGDKIGEVGNTGKSTGPHLHYEVRFKGKPMNPVNYYFLDITPQQYHDMINTAANAGNMMD